MTDRERELHKALGYIEMTCLIGLRSSVDVEDYRKCLEEIGNVVQDLYKKGKNDELNK